MESPATVGYAGSADGTEQNRPGWVTRFKREWKRNSFAYIVLIPLMLHFILFSFGPFVASFGLTFMKWPLIGTPRFVGLNNWKESFQDELVWRSLWNTVLFSIYYIVPTIMLGFSQALLISTGIRGTRILRTMVLVPYVTSGVIISGIWKYIFQGSETGVINAVLVRLGMEPVVFFSNPDLAMPVLSSLSVFRLSGYVMVFYLAGLLSIPESLYEAAEIDGASGWQKTWNITLPLLRPIHFFVAVITTIGSFKVFESMFVITQGGPAFATTTIVFDLYQIGFNMLRLGYATVVAFILLVIILILSLIQRRFLGQEVSYY